MRALAALGAALAVSGLAACNADSGVGYVEIKAGPLSAAPTLYLDSTKLEPLRNGMAILRQKVGAIRLQTDGDGGQLAMLCTIVVQKNRITSVTVSVMSRQLRCNCGRDGGKEAPPGRTCVA
jgi:hypothetical protein